MYPVLFIGFTVVTALLIPGLAQTIPQLPRRLAHPGLGGNRPVMVGQEVDPRQHPTTAMRKP